MLELGQGRGGGWDRTSRLLSKANADRAALRQSTSDSSKPTLQILESMFTQEDYRDHRGEDRQRHIDSKMEKVCYNLLFMARLRSHKLGTSLAILTSICREGLQVGAVCEVGMVNTKI